MEVPPLSTANWRATGQTVRGTTDKVGRDPGTQNPGPGMPGTRWGCPKREREATQDYVQYFPKA